MARWGSVARRGAGRLGEDSASAAWRAAGDAARERDRDRGRDPRAPRSEAAADGGQDDVDAGEAPWQPEEWVDEGAVRDEAEEAVGRGRARKRGAGGRSRAREQASDDLDADELAAALGESDSPRAATPPGGGRELDEEVRRAVGGAKAPRFEQRMRDASTAFRRGRYDEARRLARPLAESAPQVAAIRELYGLTLYRLGRWKAAARELEAFRTLTGSVEQNPVLADCYRALKRYADVDELWRELSEASPGAALVAEGRIVAAGALADQGRVHDAIRLLQPGVRPTRRAKEHHLRVAYALADLYERAGDLPQARELFQRIVSTDPDFVDVQARLRALR